MKIRAELARLGAVPAGQDPDLEKAESQKEQVEAAILARQDEEKQYQRKLEQIEQALDTLSQAGTLPATIRAEHHVQDVRKSFLKFLKRSEKYSTADERTLFPEFFSATQVTGDLQSTASELSSVKAALALADGQTATQAIADLKSKAAELSGIEATLALTDGQTAAQAIIDLKSKAAELSSVQAAIGPLAYLQVANVPPGSNATVQIIRNLKTKETELSSVQATLSPDLKNNVVEVSLLADRLCNAVGWILLPHYPIQNMILRPSQRSRISHPVAVDLAQHNRSLPVKALAWNLQLDHAPQTLESFTQASQRLAVAVLIDYQPFVCFSVLENLINRVDSCTLADLALLAGTLQTRWEVGVHNPDDEQALLEARVLEVLVRGASMLQCGLTVIGNLVETWISKYSFDSKLLLKVYKLWFESIGNTNQTLSQAITTLSQDSTSPVRSAQELRNPNRELFAHNLSGQRFGLLVDRASNPVQISHYEVKDMLHYLPNRVTTFVERRDHDGTLRAPSPFHEPLAARFVVEELPELRDNCQMRKWEGD